MANRSSNKTASVRVPAAEYDDAEAALPDGWSVPAFLATCLVALAADPARVLALIAPYRPTRPPKGRPRKARDLMGQPEGPAARRMRHEPPAD